jgi:hypothetical protein
MATKRELIAAITTGAAKLDENLTLPVVNIFDTLTPILKQIAEAVHTIDLLHLTNVPDKLLESLRDQISEANECITGFMVPSYPIGEEVRAGTMRPMVHRRDPVNINSKRGQLLNVHRDLFQTVGPIIAQQQSRLVALTSAVPINVDLSRSAGCAGSTSNLWRYMPLRNLLRMEASSGIWMVSLERLRKWSAPGMADIREGDVPPVVQRLKEEYNRALGDGSERQRFQAAHGFSDDDMEELAQSFDFSFERHNTFVSSWSCKERESMPMWSAYGDGGRGIAIRSHIGRLLSGPWRVPLLLSGQKGPNEFSGLMLRKVNYLNFDERDDVPVVNDLHLPLLKRSEFEDEREVRLIGFARAPVPNEGFPLHCNLQHIISEIVVGPHADFDATVAEIKENAADLESILITRSTLSPS